MKSLRTRLTLMVTAAVAIVLVVLAISLYLGVRDAAWRQFDNALVAHTHAIAAIAEHDEDGYEITLPPMPGTFVEVWRPDGTVLERSPGLTGDLPRAPTVKADFPVQSQRASIVVASYNVADLTLPDGRPGRAMTLVFTPRDESGNAGLLTLVVAESSDDVQATIAHVRRLFLVLGALALVAIALLTSWSVRRGLAPLGTLAKSIEHIDDKTLATRLSDQRYPEELAAPVKKLDELLARLSAAFSRERQFTADVSHELRTPLAGLRTLLEVTALSDRSTAEYKTAVGEALSITLQLVTLVENLLALARLDAGQVELAPTEIALHDFIADCWKPHAQLAASRKLAFRNELTATFTADREKLRIVVGNLLANAAEYTASGGWIEVRGDAKTIDIVDSGPPLPDEHKIFDRLYRGDAARTDTGVHCGIGLSLARSLCERMSLTLTASNLPDGTVRFRIVAN